MWTWAWADFLLRTWRGKLERVPCRSGSMTRNAPPASPTPCPMSCSLHAVSYSTLGIGPRTTEKNPMFFSQPVDECFSLGTSCSREVAGCGARDFFPSNDSSRFAVLAQGWCAGAESGASTTLFPLEGGSGRSSTIPARVALRPGSSGSSWTAFRPRPCLVDVARRCPWIVFSGGRTGPNGARASKRAPNGADVVAEPRPRPGQRVLALVVVSRRRDDPDRPSGAHVHYDLRSLSHLCPAGARSWAVLATKKPPHGAIRSWNQVVERPFWAISSSIHSLGGPSFPVRFCSGTLWSPRRIEGGCGCRPLERPSW